ncbi:MAG: RodZ domain-containing protein [Pseudomonadota bacterium]
MFGRKNKLISKAENPERGFDSYALRLGDEMRGERATMGKSLMDVQRELRIKASYIAAIENADLTAFDSLSFVAGYVRSYARYLNLDPEIVFARFCEESGFGGISALKPMESEVTRTASLGPVPTGRPGPQKARKKAAPIDPILGAGTPFANKATPVFAGFEPGALGSLAVLALLVGGIGYGGWTLVQEIQRVQVAPIEQAPELVAELDPLVPGLAAARLQDGSDEDAPNADALARLYRPQALDAPILQPRDEPIASIRPGTVGALAQAQPSGLSGPDAQSDDVDQAVDLALAEALREQSTTVTPRVLADTPKAVVLVAVRPAWVRVSAGDGNILFEKILEPGETYEVPVAEVPPTLRTGNSGALYFSVAGQTYGPVAPGPQVVSGVALAADVVQGDYAVADLDGDQDLARVVAELTAPEAGTPPQN